MGNNRRELVKWRCDRCKKLGATHVGGRIRCDCGGMWFDVIEVVKYEK